MLVKQSKDTFIRTTGNLSYIVNQKTKLERLYADTGVDYLNILSREIQCVETLVSEVLVPMYDDATFDEIFNDFAGVLCELAENGFVFIGNSYDEIRASEDKFYSEFSNRNGVSSYLQQIDHTIDQSTQETILDMRGGEPHLMSLQYELTSKCNERCIHCYIPNEKKDVGIDMPHVLFKKSIDQFAELGGLQVSLSGGEIFMHKNIVDMIRYCREKDMQISLLSNLLALTDEQVEVIKEANVSMIQASLYSMDAEIHDAITKVKGSYGKTRASIERLVQEHIPVMISCPIMKTNASGYHDILEYAHSLGIKAQTDFILMAQENMDTSNLQNRISLADTEGVIREILHNAGIDSADSISTTGQPNKVNLKETQRVCAAGITNLCINANGDVYPCNGWQGFKAGNLYRDSLSDIWRNSEALKQLRSITRGSFTKCTDCDAKDYCSICMARNYNESNGNPLHINPHLCEIAHLNKRIHEEMKN